MNIIGQNPVSGKDLSSAVRSTEIGQKIGQNLPISPLFILE
jgi:hypothetical protein